MSNNSKYARDRETVVTADLAAVLQDWIDKHNGERPLGNNLGRVNSTWFGEQEVTIRTTAIQYIVDHTDLSARSLYRILRCETYTTSLWLADAILTAIGRPDKLRDGSIRELDGRVARGNQKGPRFKSQEEWMAYLDQIGCRR